MPQTISFLVAPGFEPLDLSGPMSAVNIARHLSGCPYQVRVASVTGGMVRSFDGLAIETVVFDRARDGETVIVVGGANAPEAGQQPALTALLRSVARPARRIASVCTGAFFLAEAGLLDDRHATTHWRWAPILRSLFPKVTVDADRIYVMDGNVWTSAGITAGIDLALALIEEDVGAAIARSTAREMVVYHRRLGGQTQFSTMLELEPTSARMRVVLQYAREHLDSELTVDNLAAIACMSTRQFSRVFASETGQTPARAVERLRVEAARLQVEDTLIPLEVVARKVGFSDSERLRRSFWRVLGQSPQAVRRSAGG